MNFERPPGAGEEGQGAKEDEKELGERGVEDAEGVFAPNDAQAAEDALEDDGKEGDKSQVSQPFFAWDGTGPNKACGEESQSGEGEDKAISPAGGCRIRGQGGLRISLLSLSWCRGV